jgi:hypothetical protein
MLRPLAEGIALAMEFDALSRTSPFISGPFLASTHAFAPSDGGGDPRMLAIPTNAALLRARKSQQGISRKLNVYADPLGASGTGYLLGYLSTRSMMRHLWRSSSRLVEEGDLCVSFLRTYIYGDWEFVDIILDRSCDELTLANNIRQYLSDRLWNITSITADDIALFESLAANDTPAEDPRYAIAFHSDPVRGERGRLRLRQLAAEVAPSQTEAPSGDFQELEQLLSLVDREVLQARPMVYLGGSPATVQVRNGHCTVSVDRIKLLADIPTAMSERTGDGAIDVFYAAQAADSRRLVHITLADETVALAVRGPHAPSLPAADFSPITSRARLRQLTSIFDDVVEQAISSSWLAIATNHLETALPGVCQGLYLDVALRFVPNARRDRIREVLEQGGIRLLLRANRELSEALVLAGAITQATPLRTLAESALASEGLHPTLMDDLLAISNEGFELAMSSGNWLVMFV